MEHCRDATIVDVHQLLPGDVVCFFSEASVHGSFADMCYQHLIVEIMPIRTIVLNSGEYEGLRPIAPDKTNWHIHSDENRKYFR
jgi:hypothetical protein